MKRERLIWIGMTKEQWQLMGSVCGQFIFGRRGVRWKADEIFRAEKVAWKLALTIAGNELTAAAPLLKNQKPKANLCKTTQSPIIAKRRT